MPATINTDTQPTDTAETESQEVEVIAGSSARWWFAVAVGCAISLPTGWLLSYAGALPFMLGTFFFALLGLVIGAITFRTAGARPRYGKGVVVFGTTLIVLTGWGYSVYTEASDLPEVMGKLALKRTPDLGDQTVEEFQDSVAQGVRSYLTDHYPPGGPIGYVRWVVDSGRIPRAEIPNLTRSLPMRQHGWVWLLRVTLSVGLLAFGIGSQTLLLIHRAPSSA